MAYVDMARSHGERLLREGFDLLDVARDADGDYPFRHGAAAYFVSVHATGRAVRIWSPAVRGIKATAAVLREVNATNARLVHARAYVESAALYVESILPVEELTEEYLVRACQEVGSTADRLGSLLAAVHGGCVWFAEEADKPAG